MHIIGKKSTGPAQRFSEEDDLGRGESLFFLDECVRYAVMQCFNFEDFRRQRSTLRATPDGDPCKNDIIQAALAEMIILDLLN